ncbi:hypothetical protein TRSC58_04789 [Trypanosoma rangeli SC58]|uniref:Uncharacterized protein n=1 Tax=Trypanosoma rangeli SC58 TaxID=429131 RepID=A0A061J087_TRYRA|nr:hypothetical protein TRSC58_04789 [Trypanosoma rangeli SC58]
MATSKGTRPRVCFLDGERQVQSLMPPLSKQHGQTSIFSGVSRASAFKGSVVTGRELTNGFDRLVLFPESHGSSIKTVWHRITGPPCRLRACWCDPRDTAATYAGLLHYHCKHEPIGGDLGDMNTEGKLLDGSKMTQGSSRRVLRRVIKQVSKDVNGKKITYDGCKETGHRCESIGFYGNPKPDRSSVFFFASPHPLQANIVETVTDNP